MKKLILLATIFSSAASFAASPAATMDWVRYYVATTQATIAQQTYAAKSNDVIYASCGEGEIQTVVCVEDFCDAALLVTNSVVSVTNGTRFVWDGRGSYVCASGVVVSTPTNLVYDGVCSYETNHVIRFDGKFDAKPILIQPSTSRAITNGLAVATAESRMPWYARVLASVGSLIVPTAGAAVPTKADGWYTPDEGWEKNLKKEIKAKVQNAKKEWVEISIDVSTNNKDGTRYITKDAVNTALKDVQVNIQTALSAIGIALDGIVKVEEVSVWNNAAIKKIGENLASLFGPNNLTVETDDANKPKKGSVSLYSSGYGGVQWWVKGINTKYDVKKDGSGIYSLWKDGTRTGDEWVSGTLPDNKSIDQVKDNDIWHDQIYGWSTASGAANHSLAQVLEGGLTADSIVFPFKNGAGKVDYMKFGKLTGGAGSADGVSVVTNGDGHVGQLALGGFWDAANDGKVPKKSGSSLEWADPTSGITDGLSTETNGFGKIVVKGFEDSEDIPENGKYAMSDGTKIVWKNIATNDFDGSAFTVDDSGTVKLKGLGDGTEIPPDKVAFQTENSLAWADATGSRQYFGTSDDTSLGFHALPDTSMKVDDKSVTTNSGGAVEIMGWRSHNPTTSYSLAEILTSGETSSSALKDGHILYRSEASEGQTPMLSYAQVGRIDTGIMKVDNASISTNETDHIGEAAIKGWYSDAEYDLLDHMFNTEESEMSVLVKIDGEGGLAEVKKFSEYVESQGGIGFSDDNKLMVMTDDQSGAIAIDDGQYGSGALYVMHDGTSSGLGIDEMGLYVNADWETLIAEAEGSEDAVLKVQLAENGYLSADENGIALDLGYGTVDGAILKTGLSSSGGETVGSYSWTSPQGYRKYYGTQKQGEGGVDWYELPPEIEADNKTLRETTESGGSKKKLSLKLVPPSDEPYCIIGDGNGGYRFVGYPMVVTGETSSAGVDNISISTNISNRLQLKDWTEMEGGFIAKKEDKLKSAKLVSTNGLHLTETFTDQSVNGTVAIGLEGWNDQRCASKLSDMLTGKDNTNKTNHFFLAKYESNGRNVLHYVPVGNEIGGGGVALRFLGTNDGTGVVVGSGSVTNVVQFASETNSNVKVTTEAMQHQTFGQGVKITIGVYYAD